jgi:hypothetical protein
MQKIYSSQQIKSILVEEKAEPEIQMQEITGKKLCF